MFVVLERMVKENAILASVTTTHTLILLKVCACNVKTKPQIIKIIVWLVLIIIVR